MKIKMKILKLKNLNDKLIYLIPILEMNIVILIYIDMINL
jgi:hypothetical protein